MLRRSSMLMCALCKETTFRFNGPSRDVMDEVLAGCE
jgi:hypothetical protein